ncbi:lytic transglycosylase domain-containing protein [Comamonas sp. NLF-1-9]|uniref:lytic transglycosylase domain-containing protein n=1 Tax=Comamonas sp. NLF-1-9 TaxID=2853163 RepID=UPI001C439315|nr:lytic transglycosylase domain-containing protein [Comamonas sp. NLF-1-9]QXL83591.1 lytic transglycosylase domain-containing protein [Comamonas sp. NLF-1-9]
MSIHRILTPLIAALALTFTLPAPAQTATDEVLLAMQKAFRKGDRAQLTLLLPQASGHPLEPWAAYWELRARLEEASEDEVQAFFRRWQGSYVEDRLRNDWLLILGQRRDWQRFADTLPAFRMQDDRDVRCYTLLVEHLEGRAPADAGAQVLANWQAQRRSSDGCARAAAQLLADGRIRPVDVWRKARLGAESSRVAQAREAVQVVAPELLAQMGQALAAPTKYLTLGGADKGSAAKGKSAKRKAAPAHKEAQAQPSELVTLALVRLAMSNYTGAARLLSDHWSAHLSAEQRNWVWGAIGRQAALSLSVDAMAYFARVTRDADLSEDMLAWKARAALRAGDWKQVARAIDAMDEATRADSAWVYWRARALLAGQPSPEERARAQALYARIAGTSGFYEQLALEETGGRITVPAPPAPPTAEEKAGARANPGLNRGLYAILIGLRSEGVREWNYSTNLHTPGGMGDRELLAAAEFACAQEVWDRCINTSERTKGFIDAAQRFPMPFHDPVLRRTREIGLDAAYVYGLVRQESRFIMDARSHVGASGLMQVMPATARWTAKKIGLEGFSIDQLNDQETNIAIGTAYLKLALDDFDDSLPLAAAAYNAGPGRPRAWRNGPVLEAAIWAENVPFSETRDYVKKVLANTVNYAAIITGQPQSLKERLGQVGPRDAKRPEREPDLP